MAAKRHSVKRILNISEVCVWLRGYKFDDFNVMMWANGQEVNATRYFNTEPALKRGNYCFLMTKGVVSDHPCKRSNLILCECFIKKCGIIIL